MGTTFLVASPALSACGSRSAADTGATDDKKIDSTLTEEFK